MSVEIGMKPEIYPFEKRDPRKFLPDFMIVAGVLLFFLFSKASFAADAIRVNYTVECDDSSSLALKIKAKIQNLPAEETTLLLPDSRVTNLELFAVEGEDEKEFEKPLELPDAPLGRNILLKGKSSETVSLRYQISLSDRFPRGRHSYGDGKRYILFASDILLGFGERGARANISFELPPTWIIVTTAKKAGKGAFAVSGKQDIVFYLGKAASRHATFGQIEVWLAIEPGWEVVKEKAIGILQHQILYREKTSENTKSGSLLIALLDSTKNAEELKMSVLDNSSGFVALASSLFLKATEFDEIFRREVSRDLIQCFFPNLRSAKELTAESFFIEYLLLKTDLKTGVLSKEQFLQKIAAGFGVIPNESHRPQKRTNPSSLKAVARVALTEEEKLSNLFLLDLLLGFYGKSTSSLEQLIHAKMNSVVLEKIVEGDPPRNLFRDSGLLIQQKIVFPKGEFEDVSKRLRPFGLVFEMRELADLSFDLNEKFQVERIRQKGEGNSGALLVGDKLIAIDDKRILRPIDLITCRSVLHPGNEITLVVERNGEVQKIKHRVGRETFFRLESNRLSDSDKQEKLEAFWAREVDE